MELIKTKKSSLIVYDIEDQSKLIKACVDEVKDELNKYPPIVVFGKVRRQRRSIGFFSDFSVGCSYSNQTSKAKPLTKKLKKLMNFVNKKFKSKFNGILINRYKDGNDYIGSHSDSDTKLDRHGVVAISYGATRKFRVSNKITNKIIMDIPTKSNQIIQMKGKFQDEFKHEIPIEKKVTKKRYSFTFRRHTV